MAAHVYTGLQQVIEDVSAGRDIVAQVEAALNLSSWTEDLDLDDYDTFATAIKMDWGLATNEVLMGIAMALLKKYRAIWLDLGQPGCREEWYEAKYG